MIDLRQDSDIAGGVALQSDGKIVLSGESSAGSAFLQPSDFVVMRLNANGSPDTTFDGDGIVYTDTSAPMNPGRPDGARDVLVQPDGKIVAGGYNDASDDFTLVRYNTDGSPDTAFDGDGIVVTDFSGNTSDIREIALDGSNRIAPRVRPIRPIRRSSDSRSLVTIQMAHPTLRLTERDAPS